MKYKEFSIEEENALYDDYVLSHSLAQVAEKHSISRYFVAKIFIKNGWDKEFEKFYHKTYTFNKNYFDIIDNPNKAYCLGLLFADGNNTRQGLRIELQERDVNVLNDMKELFEYSGNLRFRDASKCKNLKQNIYRLDLNSVYLSKRLSELGCIPNKSLVLDFPEWITPDLFPFFLKGYIDGDGWVQKYRIGFMSTDKFCNGVKSFLYEHYGIESKIYDMKRHYNEHTKTFDITNRKNIIPLVQLMFSEPTIGIERKINKYKEYGFLL